MYAGIPSGLSIRPLGRQTYVAIHVAKQLQALLAKTTLELFSGHAHTLQTCEQSQEVNMPTTRATSKSNTNVAHTSVQRKTTQRDNIQKHNPSCGASGASQTPAENICGALPHHMRCKSPPTAAHVRPSEWTGHAVVMQALVPARPSRQMRNWSWTKHMTQATDMRTLHFAFYLLQYASEVPFTRMRHPL